MTLFHFINCAALTFGPHAVYYKATPLYVVLCHFGFVCSFVFPFPSRSASAVSISRVGWFAPPFQHLQMLLFIFFLPFLSFSVFIRPNPRP